MPEPKDIIRQKQIEKVRDTRRGLVRELKDSWQEARKTGETTKEETDEINKVIGWHNRLVSKGKGRRKSRKTRRHRSS